MIGVHFSLILIIYQDIMEQTIGIVFELPVFVSCIRLRDRLTETHYICGTTSQIHTFVGPPHRYTQHLWDHLTDTHFICGTGSQIHTTFVGPPHRYTLSYICGTGLKIHTTFVGPPHRYTLHCGTTS